MNKRWIALLLMLAMVCVGAVAMAEDEETVGVCPQGHYWDIYSTFLPGSPTKCVNGTEDCGVAHSSENMNQDGTCPGCGVKCGGTLRPHFYNYTTQWDGICDLCGYEHTNHTWWDTSNIGNNCTECNFYCTENGGHILETDASGESTCSRCGFTCNHYNEDYGYSQYEQENYEDSFKTCSYCGNICDKDSHYFVLIDGEYSDYYECKFCEYSCPHNQFDDEKLCTVCGYPCIHLWSGWNEFCSNCGEVCEHTELDSDNKCTVCKMQLTSNKYCVITFAPGEGGTGSMTAPTNLRVGNNYTLPNNGFTVKDGYTFKGWEVSCHDYSSDYYKYHNPNEAVELTAESVTITALWESNWIEVTYNLNGGSAKSGSTLYEAQNVTKGSSVTLAASSDIDAPAGKQFKHWTVNGSGEYAAEESVTLWNSSEIKAVYEDIPEQVQMITVTFHKNDGTSEQKTQQMEKGKQTVFDVSFERTGYDFSHWNTQANGKGDKYYTLGTFEADTDLYGQWRANWYDATFVPGEEVGEDVFTEEWWQHDEEIMLSALLEYLVNEFEFPVKDNSELIGWNDGDKTYGLNEIYVVNGPFTLTAVWQPIGAPEPTKYTVTFSANGGTGSMASVTMEAGEYTLPPCGFTAPNGKKFAGWNVNGSTMSAGAKIQVSASMTISAVWEDIPQVKYTVTFDLNGSPATMDSQEVVAGAEFTLPECELTGPSATPMFDCWIVNGKEMEAGQKITVTGPVTVKANWAKSTLTFTYKVNGGEFEADKGESVDVPVSYGLTNYALMTGDQAESELGFTAVVGKDFDYWADEQGQRVDSISKVRTDRVFKAIWKDASQIETNDIKTVQITPEMTAAGIENADDVVEAMKENASKQGYPEQQTETVDVVLMLWSDAENKYIKATTDNFPKDGVSALLDIPTAVSASLAGNMEFKLYHMITVGSDAGKIEEISATLENGKIRTGKFYSLSPVTIAWKEKVPQGVVEDLPSTGDPSSLMSWITLLGASGLGMKAIKRRKK